MDSDTFKVEDLCAFPVPIYDILARELEITCPFCRQQLKLHIIPRNPFHLKVLLWSICIICSLNILGLLLLGWYINKQLYAFHSGALSYIAANLFLISGIAYLLYLLSDPKVLSNWSLKAHLFPPGPFFNTDHVILFASHKTPHEILPPGWYTRLPSGEILNGDVKYKWANPVDEVNYLWTQIEKLQDDPTISQFSKYYRSDNQTRKNVDD